MTSCIATVTALKALVSMRGRAPRCSWRQRSPATLMNSNLLPIEAVEIIEPPWTVPYGTEAYSSRKGGRLAIRGELPEDRLDARRLAALAAAGGRDHGPQAPVRLLQVVVDDDVVVGRALLDLPPGQTEPPRDLLGAVGPALLQALPEGRLAGGEDEDQDGFGNQAPYAHRAL